MDPESNFCQEFNKSRRGCFTCNFPTPKIKDGKSPVTERRKCQGRRETVKGGPLNNVISSHRHDEREQQNLLFILFQNFTKTKLFNNALQTGGI